MAIEESIDNWRSRCPHGARWLPKREAKIGAIALHDGIVVTWPVAAVASAEIGGKGKRLIACLFWNIQYAFIVNCWAVKLKDHVVRHRGPHAQRSKVTREHILASAIEVVRTRSFQGATFFEVAKQANVTPGAVQHHFGSKAALMMQVIDELLRSDPATQHDWPKPAEPLEARARGYINTLWTHVYEPPRFLSAWNIYFGSMGDPEMRDHIASRRDGLADFLHGHFLSIFPELSDVAGIAAFNDMIFSCLRGIGIARLFGPQTESCEAQLDALAQTILQRVAIGSSVSGT